MKLFIYVVQHKIGFSAIRILFCLSSCLIDNLLLCYSQLVCNLKKGCGPADYSLKCLRTLNIYDILFNKKCLK